MKTLVFMKNVDLPEKVIVCLTIIHNTFYFFLYNKNIIAKNLLKATTTKAMEVIKLIKAVFLKSYPKNSMVLMSLDIVL